MAGRAGVQPHCALCWEGASGEIWKMKAFRISQVKEAAQLSAEHMRSMNAVESRAQHWRKNMGIFSV